MKTAHVSEPIPVQRPGGAIRVVTHADGRMTLAIKTGRSPALCFMLDPAGVQQLCHALAIPPLLMIESQPGQPDRVTISHAQREAFDADKNPYAIPAEEPLAIIGQGDSERRFMP